MKIFFIGTVEFSSHALQRLINDGADIVGVCTKEVSNFNADFFDLRPICHLHGINYKLVQDVNHPNNIEFIKSCKPDVIYCFGWSNLIKDELLRVAAKGIIGFHPAALPDNKGRHPLIWALALGLDKTASTFFFMDSGPDTGDILSQKEISIDIHDTAGTLYKKVTSVALDQISEFTIQLASNSYNRIKQDKNRGNTWRKRNQYDGKIDFRMNSRTIYNLVRALSKPYVGAHISTPNGDAKVWSVIEDACEKKNIEPGKVIALDGSKIKVKTTDGAILIVEHEIKELPKQGEYL